METCRPEILVDSPWDYVGFAILAVVFIAMLAPRALWAVPILLLASAATIILAARRFNKASRAAELVDCGGALKRPVAARPGYVVSYYHEAGRHSTTYFKFEPAGEPTVLSRLEWPHARGYIAAASGPRLYLWLPAYEILDDCCRGVYIAAVDPAFLPQRGPVQLTLSTPEGDSASAGLALRGAVLEAELTFWPVKARSARLELHVDTGHHRFKKVLLAAESGSRRVELDIGGRPGLYVIKGAVPPTRAGILGIEREGLLGHGGGGEYTARLVIDIPLRPDYHVDAQL
ncbi:MAG: hypothetical protein ACP5H5_09645 [Pyrobaculum sp.]